LEIGTTTKDSMPLWGLYAFCLTYPGSITKLCSHSIDYSKRGTVLRTDKAKRILTEFHRSSMRSRQYLWPQQFF
jgi:hypothetical protein